MKDNEVTGAAVSKLRVSPAEAPYPQCLAWVRGVGSLALGTALVVLVLPTISGMSWTQLGPAVGRVSPMALVVLALIWIAGLFVHTVALVAALPALTHRRALTLSLTGSAVSNVTPLGGAVGVGVNYHMIRAWGFSRPQFVVYTFVTNVWDVLAKLVIPAAILAALLVTGPPNGLPVRSAIVTIAILAGAIAALGAVLTSERAATSMAGYTARGTARVLRLFRSQRSLDPGSLLEVRAGSGATIREQWQRLTIGQVGYTALLFVLLWASLRATGSGLSTSQVLAGLAVERLLSLSVLTPGGAGVIEVGLVGFLIATGGPPGAIVAGVLLYRAFTFLIEIPVGGALLAGWLWADRARRRDPVREPGVAAAYEPAAAERRLVSAGAEAGA